MMNGGDLYELAKILGYSNIKMAERYAKFRIRAHHEGQQHRKGGLDHEDEEAGADTERGRHKKLRVSQGRVLVVQLKLQLCSRR
jgi:hypothetical protein